MIEIAQQIQDNAVNELRFTCNDDDAIDHVGDIITAIETKKNDSITAIHLTDDFLGCLRSDYRSELMRALVHLKNLKEVHIEDCLLLVADLANLLAKNDGLQKIRLSEIVLQGVEEDFEACELALHQHGSIKTFMMENCRPAIDSISIECLSIAHKKGDSALDEMGNPVAV